ncbi:MAG: PhzF family phenazine biosynthesis protein [Chloroflexota bacterium]
MAYDFYTTDVFTDHRFGGNPLAVFPNAAGLDTSTMQAIAREFNLSETIFFFPPDDPENTVKARIFTPYIEMPFAGHPTVGGAFILATLGLFEISGAETDIVLEEGVGSVPVKVYVDGGKVTKTVLTAAKVPEVSKAVPPADVIAKIMNLSMADILQTDYAPTIIKSGTKRLFVPLKNRALLSKIAVDVGSWHRDIKTEFPDMSSIYAYCFDPERPGSQLRGRMFSIPGMTMYEDPATGSAVTGLASYLAQQSGQTDGTLSWVMEQGFEMGRPSILEIEADLSDSVCQAIRVGGSSVLVSKGVFYL